MTSASLTKRVKKYGNSGGVYLPSSWIGGEAEVRLIRRPPVPERDILLAFSGMMEHIISIFIYGSYARGEQEGESDMDIIIVADEKGMKTPEGLKGNYDIRIMGREEIRKFAERDALFRKSLDDSRALLNESFLMGLKSLKPSRKTLRDRTGFAESSLGIIRGIFEESGGDPNLIYPLIMRIKEMLLIKCILENRRYSLKLLEDSLSRKGIPRPDFLSLIRHYRAVRDNRKPPKHLFSRDIFIKLINLLEDMVEYAKKKQKA